MLKKHLGRPWWKGKEAGKRYGVVDRLTGQGIGGRAGWKVGGRDGRWNLRGGEDTSPDRVIVARQKKKTKKKKREKKKKGEN